jgi:hypothetical protein
MQSALDSFVARERGALVEPADEVEHELAAGPGEGQIAKEGANLVLLARRQEKPLALASDLRASHDVEVTVVGHDLSRSTPPNSWRWRD